jgi:hypothetical protein
MIKTLTDIRSAPRIFSAALLIGYLVVPVSWYYLYGRPVSLRLALLVVLAVAFIYLGWHLGRTVVALYGMAIRVRMTAMTFARITWWAFVAFTVVALATADSIPFLAAIEGADSDSIAYYRELFLKARSGWEVGLVYVNAVLTGALVPYAIALSFVYRDRLRGLYLAYFLVYCVSFVEKLFFMRAALPMLYLYAHYIRSFIRPAHIVAGLLALLVLNTFLAGAGTDAPLSQADFDTPEYVPTGPVDHILWRSIAVPVFTAEDALSVFQAEFDDQYLMGSTSTFLAELLGRPRVDFERLVFAHQWGQNYTGTGSANSVFVTEAYVNWGYPGVCAVALAIGLLLRLMAASRDPAFRALWLVFCANLYVAGFVGTMLSNGFLVLFAIAVFVRFREPVAARETRPAAVQAEPKNLSYQVASTSIRTLPEMEPPRPRARWRERRRSAIGRRRRLRRSAAT